MIYNDITYRPPFEADSLLLTVTRGCSHNKCSFCNMYRNVPFQVYSLDDIEPLITQAQQTMPNTNRIFLEHGDPFVLSSNRLIEIAQRLNAAFPNLETISCYASIPNIMNKSVEELKVLHHLKINQLNIGVESASEDALAHLNKGCNQEDVYCALNKLNDAQMDFGVNIILGAAGYGKQGESATINAALINEVKPYLIFTTTLHYDTKSSLFREIKEGLFHEATVRQLLQEMYNMIEQLKLDKTYFFGLHTSNVVPLRGHLPDDKEWMLAHLRRQAVNISEEVLDDVPVRISSEGTILL